MVIDVISIVGFILAVFGAGITVGKLVEKIERFLDEKEDVKHDYKSKNDRR